MTHISYGVSKKLKDFLKDSAPEPMEGGYWCGKGHAYSLTTPVKGPINSKPFYKLHDLLSKPFCEAMAKKRTKWHADGISEMLWGNYYSNGLPGVERSLLEMMKVKP